MGHHHKRRKKMKKNKKNSYYPVEELYKWVNQSILCLVGCNKADQRIADLEAKLAEKDEEIAYLTKQVKKFNNEAQKYFEDAYCNDFHNQDKISFAVEQLTQANDYVQQYVNNFDDMNDCLCAIDNQIKRLTHQHEEKGE